ncbi:MAG: formate/nitrite transporter family protein [Deltaproteobacteria bacterium]|nr:formate/nitrite transporter family protein [Deltaproteobacteria bacterium]
MTGIDHYTPAEIASLIDSRGVTKAKAPALTTLALGVLAGCFIALGGVFSTLASTGSNLGFGPTRVLSGLVFSLGLILVIVAGAELFTGNNLIVMSWIGGRISARDLLRNWGLVYIGNFIGALSIVLMVYYGRWWDQDRAAVGGTAVAIATAKVHLPFFVALVRGILANALVCLAVWLAAGGRSVVDKVFGIVFPIAAFVAGGFEHSVANMYFIPLGLLLSQEPAVSQAAGISSHQLAGLTWSGFWRNLAAATVGNVIGGGVLVGLVYWFIYLRNQESHEEKS